ncbi:MAG: DUF2891 domain-containing protein [Chloroflexota bacterium]
MIEKNLKIGAELVEKGIVAFAELAMAGIVREFPYAPQMVVVDESARPLPRTVHPVFYGCFDWHSAVHSHWMLIRLLKLYPETAVSTPIRTLLNGQFTRDKLQTETDYFAKRPSFERMYGWAWALRLALELHGWQDSEAQQWRDNYRPLEQKLVSLIFGYLPRLDWPIRCGFHPETAFALGQILDYARGVGNSALADLVEAKSRQFYGADRNYPTAYEPSGQDFFSAGLNTADLLRRVFALAEFSAWLSEFFPELANGRCGNLLHPVSVSDVTDGGLVHLAGLNLSRAWTMNGIAQALPSGDPRQQVLATAAQQHAEAGLAYVFSGDYMGEHWLASFAVYMLTEVGV